MAHITSVLDEMANTLQAAVDADTELIAAGIAVQVWSRILYDPSQVAFDMWAGDPFTDDTATGFTDQSGKEFYTLRARTTGDQKANQDVIYRFMSRNDPLNVQKILMEDDTLNGLVSNLYVPPPAGPSEFVDNIAQGKMFGTIWQVQLLNADS